MGGLMNMGYWPDVFFLHGRARLMTSFTNILVGVDLSQCRPLSSSSLSAGALDTIETANWLAQAHKAKLLFFAALNLTEDALHHLDHEDRTHVTRTVEQAANQVLGDLVRQSQRRGIEASAKLARGKGWEEIIRQVLRDKHDLVVVGTRDLTGLRRMLFGNTALKLLRRCPCPVWVCKPGRKSSLNIMVATALKSASEQVLRFGISLAQVLDGNAHVLHVVEYPLDRLGWTGLPDEKTTEYHQRVRAAAQDMLHTKLEKTGYRELGARCQIHLAEGAGIPDAAIQHYLQLLDIDLLVMGTIGRTGLAGMFIGNTAERLLPEVHCSVLAVKPPDFQCPVVLN
jgi:universal stress protein E